MAQPVLDGRRIINDALELSGVTNIVAIFGRELEYYTPPADIRVTIAHNEQSGALAAEVIGRITGHPAVFMCTMGPGATNALTGIASAYAERSPLVWIVFQVEQELQHPTQHQYLPIASMCRSICKEVHEPTRVDDLSAVIQRAVTVAAAGLPGPVAVVVPIDLLHAAPSLPNNGEAELADASRWLSTNDPRLTGPLEAHDGLRRISRPDDLRAVVAESASPLLVAGGGVVRRRLAKEILAVLENLSIPVMTSQAAKGIVPESHPLSAGCLSAYLDCVWRRPGLLQNTLDRADLLILAGFDEAEGLTAKHLRGAPPILSLDGQEHLAGQVPLDWLCELALPDSLRELARIERRMCRTDTADRDIVSARSEAMKALPSDGPIFDPVAFVAALSDALPHDTWVCVDVGLHKHVMGVVAQIETPYRYLSSNGLASMGFGLPAAIGVALARPGEKVVAVCGDGGYLAVASELETAVRLSLDITVFVLQDGEFGLIHRYQANGPLSDAVDTPVRFTRPSLRRLSHSYGCTGATLSKLADIAPNVASSQKGPRLIAVPVSYVNYLS